MVSGPQLDVGHQNVNFQREQSVYGWTTRCLWLVHGPGVPDHWSMETLTKWWCLQGPGTLGRRARHRWSELCRFSRVFWTMSFHWSSEISLAQDGTPSVGSATAAMVLFTSSTWSANTREVSRQEVWERHWHLFWTKKQKSFCPARSINLFIWTHPTHTYRQAKINTVQLITYYI